MDICGQSISELKCAQCHLYLSVGPITHNSNNFFCGRCSNEGKPVTIYEVLAQKFAFPCRYQPWGCRKSIEWGFVQNHEQNCPKKPHLCPAAISGACQWLGPVLDIHNHFRQAHAEEIIHTNLVEIQLHSDMECCKLLEINDDCFVFYMYFNKEQELLKLNVMDLNGTKTKKENKYNLILYSKDLSKEISFASTTAEPYDTLDHNTIKEDNVFDIGELKSLTNDQRFIYCKIMLNVEEQNETVRTEIMEIVECPICKECFSSQIYQCQIGHSFCSSCTTRLNDCPLCHQRFIQTRNYALENLVNQMTCFCKNKELGCTFKSIFEEVKLHEETCELYTCPLQTSQNCNWRGIFEKVAVHCTNNHVYLESEGHVLLCSITNTSAVFQLVYFGGVFFRLCWKYHNNLFCVIVQFVGPHNRAGDYVYEFSFVTSDNVYTNLTLTDCCHPFTNDETVFEDSFKIPFSVFGMFVKNNEFNCNIKIVRK